MAKKVAKKVTRKAPKKAPPAVTSVAQLRAAAGARGSRYYSRRPEGQYLLWQEGQSPSFDWNPKNVTLDELADAIRESELMFASWDTVQTLSKV